MSQSRQSETVFMWKESVRMQFGWLEKNHGVTGKANVTPSVSVSGLSGSFREVLYASE